MKQKKSAKKLNLNKNTIAALDSRQIKAAYGGDTYTGESVCYCRDHCEITNPSCPPTEDPTATVGQLFCPCCM
jgi:natural product precursor